MYTDQPDYTRIHPKKEQNGRLSRQARHMRRGNGGIHLQDITLSDILHKLWLGLSKLLVALRYQFHRRTAGVFSNVKLPWYKLAGIAIVLLIVTKKDIQFSINMKAPLPGAAESSSSQMGLAQPVALRAQEAVQIDEQRAHAYIKRFSKVAAAEMEKFGMPASVKMAQALLESMAGEHSRARQANNHFGKPLSGRQYNSAWENWRAHSLLLQNEYPALFDAGANYKQWARGLEQSGYSNDRQYGSRLVDLIEKFQLYNLDQF